MITSKIKNIKNYKGIDERIDKAIDFVLTFDSNKPDGRYEIDGNDIYANVVTIETEDASDFQFEAHRKYLDLQYILSGNETMIYAPVDDCKQITEYNESDDYLLLTGTGTKITVSEGTFYLVHPFDAHAPGLQSTSKTVRKIIVKIKY